MKTVDLVLPLCRDRALDLEEVENGIEKIQMTAIRLLKDARLLLNARRHTTAATIAAMAIMEMGRVAALLDLATARSTPEIKSAWRRFRQPDEPFPWALLGPGIGKAMELQINNLLSLLRTVGSRVECLDSGDWISGDQLIRRELAAELIATAEKVCGRRLSQQAVRIWIDVAKSLPSNTPADRMLGAYADALDQAGLPGELLWANEEVRDLLAEVG